MVEVHDFIGEIFTLALYSVYKYLLITLNLFCDFKLKSMHKNEYILEIYYNAMKIKYIF